MLPRQCQNGAKPAFGRAPSLLAMRLPTLPHPKTFAPIAINHSLSGSVHRPRSRFSALTEAPMRALISARAAGFALAVLLV
ncbi:hypothetical protein ABTF68_20795, partial [Acinetobacter baumannii]